MGLKRRLMAQSLSALLMFSNLPTAADAKTRALSAKVRSAIGQVHKKCVTDVNWIEVVKGMQLAADCLLQVGEGGKLALSFAQGKKSGSSGKDLMITSPVLLRLSDAYARKTKVSQHFYRMTKDAAKEEAGQGLLYSMEEAWNKLEFMLDLQGSPQDAGFVPYSKSEEISLYSKNSSLDMYLPQDNSETVVQELPATVDVRWDQRSAKSRYAIYAWKANETRPDKPFDQTPGTSYALKLFETGSYYVQIVSDDKKWSSSPHLFHVRMEEPSSPEADALQAAEEPELLQLLDKDAMLISASLPITATFRWRTERLFKKVQLHLRSDVGGGDERIVNANLAEGEKQIAEASLPRYGIWEWWISVEDPAAPQKGKRRRLTSTKGRLELQASKPELSASKLNGYLEKGAKTAYLSDGL